MIRDIRFWNYALTHEAPVCTVEQQKHLVINSRRQVKLFSGHRIKFLASEIYCFVILPGTAGKRLRNFLLWVTFVEMRRKMYNMSAVPVSRRYNCHHFWAHKTSLRRFNFQKRMRKHNGLCNMWQETLCVDWRYEWIIFSFFSPLVQVGRH